MNDEKLIFPKGTVSKYNLEMIRVEPKAKKIIDRIVQETGLTQGYVATAIILWAEDKIEVM